VRLDAEKKGPLTLPFARNRLRADNCAGAGHNKGWRFPR
jgi:hypothetical protein